MVIVNELLWKHRVQALGQALENGVELFIVGAEVCSADQCIGEAGKCASPRPRGRSTGPGNADAAEVEAALAGAQARLRLRQPKKLQWISQQIGN